MINPCCQCCICPQPRRLSGPTGPTGPRGPSSGEDLAVFRNASISPLLPKESLNLIEDLNRAFQYISHTDPQPEIILQPSYYRVTYSVNVTANANGQVALSAKLNNSEVFNSLSVASAQNAQTVNLSRSFVFLVSALDSKLSFVSEGVAAVFDGLNIIVERIFGE